MRTFTGYPVQTFYTWLPLLRCLEGEELIQVHAGSQQGVNLGHFFHSLTIQHVYLNTEQRPPSIQSGSESISTLRLGPPDPHCQCLTPFCS